MTDFNFTGIDNMNDAYKTSVREKAKKLMRGKESITAEKAISIFKGYNKNLSPEMADKIQKIAAMDGDTNVSLSEMSAIYALFDMELGSDNKFHFDNKIGSNDAKFGITEAYNKDVQLVVDAFKTEEEKLAAKKLEHIDTSKYDKTKPFEEKILSNDADEAMLAVQDKLSVGVDKRTGKSVSVTQAVVMFEDYISKHEGVNCKKIAEDFTEETGIPVSGFYESRSGNVYQIGNWEYDIMDPGYHDVKLLNRETNEVVYGKSSEWNNSHSYTIPFAKGYCFTIEEYYNKNEGIYLSFTYGGKGTDSMAPIGANININGQTSTVEYDEKSAVDPDLYNFIEK